MMPTTAGRYTAIILEKAVSETGPNNLATWVAKYQLTAAWNGEAWEQVEQGLEITGYHYIEKKDGSINETSIKAFKEALGWDGKDVLWLNDFDHNETQVQLVIEADTYNGKTSLKVKWLNAMDSDPNGGGIKQADEGTRKSIANRLGSKLRALGGGTSVAAPAKPMARKPALAAPAAAPTNGKPVNGAAKGLRMPLPKPAPAAPPVETVTQEQAWEWYVGEARALGIADEEIAERFNTAAGQIYVDADLTTVKDWSKFKAEAQQIPF
jgi:hypothetical protein